MAIGRNRNKHEKIQHSSESRTGNGTGPARQQGAKRHDSYAPRAKKPVSVLRENAADRTWVEKERDKNGKGIQRRFVYIIGFCVVLLVVIILSAMAVTTSSSSSSQQDVSASDTYAVSSSTRSDMETKATGFATALLVSTYSSDEDAAQDARNVALSCMSNGTDSYTSVQNMALGKGSVPSNKLNIDVTDLHMTSGTRAYASTYTYELNAQALKSDDNGNKAYVDPGYKMKISFQQTSSDDDSGNTLWLISDVEISEANN